MDLSDISFAGKTLSEISNESTNETFLYNLRKQLELALAQAETEEEKQEYLENLKDINETIADLEKMRKETEQTQAAIREEIKRTEAFYKKHADAISVLFGDDRKDERDDFIEALTPDACRVILKEETPRDGLKEALSFKAKTRADMDYKTASVYDLFEMPELVLLYEQLQVIKEREPLSKPQKVKLMNDLVSNTMLANDGFLQDIIGSEIDGQMKLFWQVNPSGRKEEDYFITFSLSYDSLSPEDKKRFDPFDLSIINYVGSTMYYQQLATGKATLDITANELWGIITGAKDLSKVSPRPEKLEQLNTRLKRLKNIEITMNTTEEILNSKYTFHDERLVSGNIEDNMLHYAKLNMMTEKGRIVPCYHFYALPILYAYCLSKKQMITVPSSYLEIDGRTDERTIIFRDYLVKEIVRAKSGKRRPVFALSTIYEKTGTPTPKERILKRAAKNKKKDVDTSSNVFKAQLSREISKDCDRINKILGTWEKNGIIHSKKQTGRGMKIKFTVTPSVPEIEEKEGQTEGN